MVIVAVRVVQCGGHPSCYCDWCMGSLCVLLSYLSEGSAVHCAACLHHHACGCPPNEVIGCERDGDLCLKEGGWSKVGGVEGMGLGWGLGLATRAPSWIAYIWDTTVTWLVTQNSISQTWDFCCAHCWSAVNVWKFLFAVLSWYVKDRVCFRVKCLRCEVTDKNKSIVITVYCWSCLSERHIWNVES